MGVFFLYSGKRRFEPLPLSVRYALECNISVLGTDNQPVGVVFCFGLRALAAIDVVYVTFWWRILYFVRLRLLRMSG